MASPQELWSGMVEVDELTVHTIVDNETDGMSTACACCDPNTDPSTATPYTSEFATLTQAFLAGKLEEFTFEKAMFAGHGLSLLLTARAGDQQHVLLFDGGPRPELWRINAERGGVDCAAIEAAVLSHWHCDHSLGLVATAQMASAARAADPERGTAPPLVFDLHPDRPYQRGWMMPNGDVVPLTKDAALPELQLPGCCVELHAEPHTLLDGFFYVSGAIPRVTPYETGLAGGMAKKTADAPFEKDELLMDERYLAVKVKDQGAVVFSSCSHAGIVNVVKDVMQVSGKRAFGVVGGFHLSTRPFEARITETVADLKALDPHIVVGGHCTGWRAKAALVAAFPGRFQPGAVGAIYRFKAPQAPEAPAAPLGVSSS